MALTDLKIRATKPLAKDYKLCDREGLYILVHKNGSKYWRLKYRYNNKEKTYAIGLYPDISLAEARDESYRLKKLLKQGIDPNAQKLELKQRGHIDEQNTFKSVALEWHSKNLKKWTEKHQRKIKRWINDEIIPAIGHLPISEVKTPDIVTVIRKIELRGSIDVARRVLNVCSQILRYGMPLGLCEHDVTLGLSKTLEYAKRKNHKCIKIEEFPELLKKIEKHNCSLVTKCALKMIGLTFVRSTELREARWNEIDFEKAEWRIPAERMKMNNLHIVPLSKQALAILKSLKAINLSDEIVFPNQNNFRKVISENTMLYALYDMGYNNRMTVHGFRQLASTILNEKGFNSDAIERQLSHSERNNVRRAYNHAQYLSERKQIMQWWADYIDNLTHEW